MMKKIFLAILTMMLSINAYANIHIDGKTARTIILEHIEQAHQLEALKEYNVQLKATGNSTMSVSGLYKVCAAAGWDISKAEDKYKCNKFVQALVEKSDYKYYEVCGNGKGKSGGTEHCIDNVFYSLIGGTQVTKLQADGLCKEYAHVKYNDDIECSTDTRKGTINPLNDYVKCTSKLNPVYYEFKFDDITESVDFTIQQSVQESLCKIYGLKFQKSIGTPDANGNLNMTTPYCETKDTNLCKKISESAKRFNYYAEIRTGNFYGSGYCGLYQTNKIYSQRDFKTAYGIANDIFYNNLIQIQGSKDIKAGIKQYIADKIKPEQIIKFQCNDNPIQIGSIRGKSDNDDVLTCYVNDNQIDFVFDDLSEAMKLYRMAGQEAFSCVVNGGTYTGKRCVNLNEEQCKKIAQSTFLAEDCPECKTAYWDGNICTLPNAGMANALQKGLNISLIVGGAVLNVVVTVQTGGANTAVGGGLLFVETVGSAIELGTEIRMDLAADKFFVESAQCKDKNCAKNLIGKHLQRLSNFYSRLTDAEEKAIDHEMARLFELIPAEELISVDALVKVDQENGSKKLASVKENQKGFFDPKSWEPEQIWQAVGITMQMASLFYQIGSWAFGKSGKTAKAMTEVADVLDDKADEAMKAMSRNSDEVIDAAVVGAKNSDDVISTLNVIDRSKLSTTDQEFYDLWKAYAPKDQSFDAFKALSDGDISKMREMTKTMKVWNYDDLVKIEQGDFERLFKTRPDIEKYFYANGYDAMIDKFPEARAIMDISDARQISGRVNIKFEQMLDDYVELSENYRKGCGGDAKCLEQGAKELKKMREAMNNTDGFLAYIESGATGNYSTYSSDLARVKSKKEEISTTLDVFNNTTDKMRKELGAMNLSNSDNFDRADELINKISLRDQAASDLKTSMKNVTIIDMEKAAPMANVDEVALERANQVKDIIDGNPRFKQMQQNYTRLSNTERVQFAQELSDEMLRVNGINSNYKIPVQRADYSKTDQLGGLFYSMEDKYNMHMEFDPNKLGSFDEFINTVSHEIGGHGIEKLNPNVTALGAQRLDVGKGVTSKDYRLYRLEATEQSAYKVGDAVQQVFTNITD